MAKKSEEPADISSLQQAATTFTKQTDRGSALIAAAWVDDALEVYLRASFRPDKKIANEILRPDGPLGSFSARIKSAYLLGIIEPTAFRDLEIVRAIRNDFAHVRQRIRFTDPSIKERCKRLHAVKALDLGGLSIRSPRQMFLVSAYFLSAYLLTLSETVQRPRILEEDYYGTGIRRFAKSASLKQINTILEMIEKSGRA